VIGGPEISLISAAKCPVHFSLFKAKFGILTKEIDLVDGALKKSTPVASFGTVTRITADFSDLPAILADLSVNTCMMAGVIRAHREAIERGVIDAGIVTPKLDRMFRSSLDALDNLAKLKELGVSLHMIDLGGDVTGNGISKLVFTILSAVAEAERDRIRERVRDVKKDQRQRGRYLGGIAPFGWRRGDDGDLVAVPEQRAAIDRTKALRAAGQSFRAIAATMTAEGVKLSHETVGQILRAAS